MVLLSILNVTKVSLQNLWFDFYDVGIADHHDMAFLYCALHLHVAASQQRQRQSRFASQLQHCELAQALQFAAILIPPDVSGSTVDDDHDFARPPAGLTDHALVGEAHFYPAFDCAREVLVPQIGLVITAQTFPKGQPGIRI